MSTSVPPAATESIAMTPALQAYYADRGLMWRNVLLIQLGWLGHGICFTFVGPLTQLHQATCGIGPVTMAWMQTVNQWLVAFLVMYFSWRSDRTRSRIGRRNPYLFISLPFIAVSALLTPFFENHVSLILLAGVGMLFMDMKLSTYSLLMIDCMPRAMLARANAVGSIIGGISGFVLQQWGYEWAAAFAPWAPFAFGAGVLTVLTCVAGLLIREPPVEVPAMGVFRPWSALAIGWRDRRAIILMLGVGLVFSFLVVQEAWMWLFAKDALGLSRESTAKALSWAPLVGIAMAYPIGWAIDRIGLLRMTTVFVLLQLAACWVLYHATTARELIVFSMMMTITYPLYAAADMMVYKYAAPEHMGSVTSSNSFLRNILRGTTGLAAGYLISWSGGHDYRHALVFGAVASVVGFALIVTYRILLRRRPVARPDAAAQATEPAPSPA